MSKEAKNFNKVESFGLVRCFPPKIEETSKTCQKMSVFQWVLWFFDVFSNLAEKQRTKPIDSSSMKFFASFDTNDTPGSAKIKPERKFDQMSQCDLLYRGRHDTYYQWDLKRTF